MTDYQYTAQLAHDKSRRPGDPTWLELPVEQRDMLAEFAKAVESMAEPELDPWCPNCDDLRDEIREHEDVIDDLRIDLRRAEETIEELRKQLPVGSQS